jgi:hypothetical protein
MPLRSHLHCTNGRMGSWLDKVLPQQASVSLEQMSAVLSDLMSTGACLRANPIPAKGTDPELDDELERYRQNVERLREILPSLHAQLLKERARIEAQRSRVHSTEEWARSLRQTF